MVLIHSVKFDLPNHEVCCVQITTKYLTLAYAQNHTQHAAYSTRHTEGVKTRTISHEHEQEGSTQFRSLQTVEGCTAHAQWAFEIIRFIIHLEGFRHLWFAVKKSMSQRQKSFSY